MGVMVGQTKMARALNALRHGARLEVPYSRQIARFGPGREDNPDIYPGAIERLSEPKAWWLLWVILSAVGVLALLGWAWLS